MNTKSRNISDVYGKYTFWGVGGGEGFVLKLCNLNYNISGGYNGVILFQNVFPSVLSVSLSICNLIY